MLTHVHGTLLKYLKPCSKSKDGLPDPNESLSAVTLLRAIAQANREVQQAIADQSDEQSVEQSVEQSGKSKKK